MRSFSVRSAFLLLLLATALFLAVLLLRPESTDVSTDDTRLADRPEKSRVAPTFRSRTLLAAPVPTPFRSPEDALISSLRAEISDLDRETNGSFLETLDAVLADPRQSIALGSFRLPAHGGSPAMLDTFPDEASSPTEEHDRLVLIYVASAFRGCASDDDYRRHLDELSIRYPWLVAYLSRP